METSSTPPVTRPNPATTRRFLHRAAILTALLVVPGAAFANTVRGKVSGARSLLNPVWNEAKETSSRRYTFREPSPTVRADAQLLTGHLPKELCIAVFADEKTKPGPPIRVVVAGGRTSPVTLVVTEGQQIQFENHDPFKHRLHDPTGKSMPAADLAPSQQRAWTAPAPGKYEIRDELSPSLRSWIVVEPKVVSIAYPNRKGDFALDVEPGRYRVQGFFNGEPVGKELELNVTPAPAEQLLRAPLVVGTDKPSGN